MKYDNYASHLAVLHKLNSQYMVKNVLEFGAGTYSTAAFLNKDYYPFLSNLTSYETDRGWYEALREKWQKVDDSRLDLIFTSMPLHEIARFCVYCDYDLVFVDNGSKVGERVQVLETLNEIQPPSLVVVHDYDVREYQHATRDFPLRLVYSGLTPHTALLFSKNCPYTTNWVWNAWSNSDD